MKVVIQRVSKASVVVEEHTVGHIQKGLLLLIGFEASDTESSIQPIFDKIIKMRIFADDQGKMNLSLADIQGAVLLVSQFTLLANTQKGNRPSFVAAAPPSIAIPLYEFATEYFIEKLGEKQVSTGIFGADMQVELVNDGPVTIVI